MSKKAKETKPPKDYTYQGVPMHICYDRPSAMRHTLTPCRARITPKDPLTGDNITKRQLYGTDYDTPVQYPIYGTDYEDIWTNQRELASAHLVDLMILQELIPNDTALLTDSHETAELATLAREYKDIVFEEHHIKWADSTKSKYGPQYDTMVEALGNLSVANLDKEGYQHLQERICLEAAAGSKKYKNWKYGDEPPPSARTRMSLLCELIKTLKKYDVPVPVEPYGYNGKPSHQQQLLDRTDRARSLPENLLRQIITSGALPLHAAIMADTGLRISEAAGLLFESIRTIDTSQGTMYYLAVTGQLAPSGKRSEITKTDTAYRVIPLSQELGAAIIRQRQELEARYGDLSLSLMCGHPDGNRFDDSPSVTTAWKNALSDQLPKLLRAPDSFTCISNNRMYLFNLQRQDEELLSMLTAHSFRRNYCTNQYSHSGLDSPEIYREMGHVYAPNPRAKPGGLSPYDLRLMCLYKHVSKTLYHPTPHGLQYDIDGHYQCSEVPACDIQLTFPPGSSIDLIVEDTEPDTITHITTNSLTLKPIYRGEQHETAYNYSLLTSDRTNTILTKRKLL